MKYIYSLSIVLLLSFSFSMEAYSAILSDIKIDKESVFEETQQEIKGKVSPFDKEGSGKQGSLFTDDDWKLQAPPPDQVDPDDNPQKVKPGEVPEPPVVLPLGNYELLAFLLLSFLWVGYYGLRKTNKRIIIEN